MTLSPESFALFVLCSHLEASDESDAKPLSPKAWTELEQRLAATSLTPADLHGESPKRIKCALDLADDQAERIARLLDRSSAMEQQLERLQRLGVWVITRLDESYPRRFVERLKGAAPLMLFGAGDKTLLGRRGLAIVGSRNIDSGGFALTEQIGNACAESRLVVYSGGARGVDKTAMGTALSAGGAAVGLLADSLERAMRAADARKYIEEGCLALATPYSPSASFSVGMAMGRNKLIYALSDFALVIACDAQKGGTWAGAEEALKNGWVPVFVVDGPDSPDGNRLLITRGAIPFPAPFVELPSSLGDWMEEHAPASKPAAVQGSLFG